MYAMCIVIMTKIFQLPRKILAIQEERLVKEFSADRSNKSFDEGM